MQLKISIIVVNWNSGTLTAKAITPYINYSSPNISCEIIIVDNASSDNSVAILKSLPVQLICNKTNTGFGHACNLAFAEVKQADYILLLNPDTESSPEVMESLTTFLTMNPKYAVVGPQQKGYGGKIIQSCGRFPGFATAFYEVTGLSKVFPNRFTPAPLMLDWDHLHNRDVDHIMGSYMLIRKSVLDKTGFMDEDFFVYGEDLDLSKRIADAGYKSHFKSDCCIYHTGGGSGENAGASRLFYSIYSRQVYWKKHLNKTAYLFLVTLSFFPEPLIRIIKSPKQISKISTAYFFYVRKLLSTGKKKIKSS